MGVVYNTLLATSQPLTICHGFPLFPKGDGPFNPSDQRTGIFKQITLVDLDEGLPILDLVIVGVDLPIRLKIDLKFFMGFCGPSYALAAAVTGETFDGGTAVLQFTGGEAKGGFAFALAVGFSLEFSIGLRVWYDVFVADGSFDIFSIGFTLNLTFDLMEAAITAIRKYLTKRREEAQAAGSKRKKKGLKIDAIDPVPTGFFDYEGQPTGLDASVWGLYDQTEDATAMDNGQLIIEPQIVVQINLAPYIPYVQQLAEMLEVVGGEVGTGPQLTVTFPITINVYKLITDGDTYDLARTLSADSGDYQQLLAVTAIEAYKAKDWYIPQLPELLAIAGRNVLLGIYPDTTAYLSSLIEGAGGDVPPSPSVVTGMVGNSIGFQGGPDTAARLVDKVTVQFTHQVGMTVGIGWFFHISVLGLTLDVSVDITFDPGQVFGPLGGTKIDQLTNTNGGQFILSSREQEQCVALAEEARRGIERKVVDVVFESVVS